MTSTKPAVYILGAGVIGLTTAIRLQESKLLNYDVHVIASQLPGDPLSPSYASSAAGAHHLSFADNEDARQRWLDTRTFEVMWAELEQAGRDVGEGEKEGDTPLGLMKLQQVEYFDGEESHLKLFEGLPDFRLRTRAEIPPRLAATHSISFTSLTMTPEIYLERLLDRFISNGGHIHRSHLTHLSQAVTLIPDAKPKAIVVCLGLGALTLAGLEDKAMFPIRGQVLALDAPWCNVGFTFQQGKLKGGEGGRRSYIIPRSNGQVIVGGTREINDWNVNPRLETSTTILEGVLALGGSKLFPANTPQSEQTVERLRKFVLKEVVGWRPTRSEGVRIESAGSIDTTDGIKIPIIANYGHGGFGWQSCWGSAELTRELLGGETLPEVSARFQGCLSTDPVSR